MALLTAQLREQDLDKEIQKQQREAFRSSRSVVTLLEEQLAEAAREKLANSESQERRQAEKLGANMAEMLKAQLREEALDKEKQQREAFRSEG